MLTLRRSCCLTSMLLGAKQTGTILINWGWEFLGKSNKRKGSENQMKRLSNKLEESLTYNQHFQFIQVFEE